MTPFFDWVDTAGGRWPEMIIAVVTGIGVLVWMAWRGRHLVRPFVRRLRGDLDYRAWQSLRRPQRERVRP